MFACTCRYQDPPPLSLTCERIIQLDISHPYQAFCVVCWGWDKWCTGLEMPHEIPPPETCHGVSGSHPNTHTNTCSSSPTPTHTCLAHAVCVRQEAKRFDQSHRCPTDTHKQPKGTFLAPSSDLHLCWASICKTPCASNSMVAAYIPLWTSYSSPHCMSIAGITPPPSLGRWTLQTYKKFPHFQTNRRSSA